MSKNPRFLILIAAALGILAPRPAPCLAQEDILAGFEFQRAGEAEPPRSSARRASSAATRTTGTAFPGNGGSTGTCSSSACPGSTGRSPRPRWTWRRSWAFPDCSCRRDSWPGLLGSAAAELDGPSAEEAAGRLAGSDLFVFADPASGFGAQLARKIPADADWRRGLNSHQFGPPNWPTSRRSSWRRGIAACMPSCPVRRKPGAG